MKVPSRLTPVAEAAPETRWCFTANEVSECCYLDAQTNLLEALDQATGARLLGWSGQQLRWHADATSLLLRFARYCAHQVVHLWPSTVAAGSFLKTGDPAGERTAWLDSRSRFEVFRWPSARAAAQATWWAAHAGQEPYVRARQAADHSCSALAAWARGNEPPNRRSIAGRQARQQCRQAQQDRLLALLETEIQ